MCVAGQINFCQQQMSFWEAWYLEHNAFALEMLLVKVSVVRSAISLIKCASCIIKHRLEDLVFNWMVILSFVVICSA